MRNWLDVFDCLVYIYIDRVAWHKHEVKIKKKSNDQLHSEQMDRYSSGS